jgi:hypothetical protein
MNDPKKFVANLEIASETTTTKLVHSKSGLQDFEEEKKESFVNNKSLVSFISGVSGQNRKDVLNSTLLAQRAADKKFSNPDTVMQWYDTYMDVLTNIGWVIDTKDFSTFSASKTLFEMEDAVIKILSAMIGQNYVAIITDTLEAMKALGDDDGRIKVFESNAHQFQKGNFQIGMANETNGVVSMHIGAFMLETQDQIRRILFFKSGNDKSSLRVYTIKGTLNNDVYSLVRNDILEKLGQTTQSYIGKLEI